jgi:hypothetical protein
MSSIITVAYTATVQNEKDVLRQPASARPLKSDLAPHVPNRDVYPLLIRRHEGIVSVGSNVDPIYRRSVQMGESLLNDALTSLPRFHSTAPKDLQV